LKEKKIKWIRMYNLKENWKRTLRKEGGWSEGLKFFLLFSFFFFSISFFLYFYSLLSRPHRVPPWRRQHPLRSQLQPGILWGRQDREHPSYLRGMWSPFALTTTLPTHPFPFSVFRFPLSPHPPRSASSLPMPASSPCHRSSALSLRTETGPASSMRMPDLPLSRSLPTPPLTLWRRGIPRDSTRRLWLERSRVCSLFTLC